MSKFEKFLKRVLTAIFKEMPFNKQTADKNLEKIIKATKCNSKEENNNGHSK